MQMGKCLEEHAALRRQLREATQAADHLLGLQKAEAHAAEDAVRLQHSLVMAEAATRHATLTRQMQLEAQGHQVLRP